MSASKSDLVLSDKAHLLSFSCSSFSCCSILYSLRSLSLQTKSPSAASIAFSASLEALRIWDKRPIILSGFIPKLYNWARGNNAAKSPLATLLSYSLSIEIKSCCTVAKSRGSRVADIGSSSSLVIFVNSLNRLTQSISSDFAIINLKKNYHHPFYRSAENI